MNTIFWLSVTVCIFSALFIIWQINDYMNSSLLERFYYRPRFWMYPSFILSMVIALTIYPIKHSQCVPKAMLTLRFTLHDHL
jgi:hypothetical protein